MIGRGHIEHLDVILETEAEAGIGILGLWVNWTQYRHQPELFSDALTHLPPRAGRDEAASEMNRLWGALGVAALVHRRKDLSPQMAGDPSAWIETELRTQAECGGLAQFMDAVAEGGHHRCFAAIILADEPFPYDGKSKSEWQYGARSLPITVHDADNALPAGLGRLKHYDDRIQTQIGLLQRYLGLRWSERLAADEGAARTLVAEVADEFVSRNGAKRARLFASVTGEGKQLTADELRLVRDRVTADFAAAATSSPKLRLSSRNTGLLSWFLPSRGESVESPAKLFARCFGPARFMILMEDTLASAMLNNLDDTERTRVRGDPGLVTAIHTLITAVAAMRLSNIFAHEDQYKFRLPTYVLHAVCRNELRNLERVNQAWRY